MRTFRLSAPLQAWLDAMLALHPDAPGPALPPAPADPEELAFYQALLVPIAQAKAAVVASVPPPAPTPAPQPWDTSMSTP